MANYPALANGLLFTNGYKKEKKQPDFVGSAELTNGAIVNLSVWKKGQDKNGNKLPTGTYYYVIEFASTDDVYGPQTSGWIYLNRNAN